VKYIFPVVRVVVVIVGNSGIRPVGLLGARFGPKFEYNIFLIVTANILNFERHRTTRGRRRNY